MGRATTNKSTAKRYVELMKNGITFPPVVVDVLDDENVLVDGFHRLEATNQLGKDGKIHRPQQQITADDAVDEPAPFDTRLAINRIAQVLNRELELWPESARSALGDFLYEFAEKHCPPEETDWAFRDVQNVTASHVTCRPRQHMLRGHALRPRTD